MRRSWLCPLTLLLLAGAAAADSPFEGTWKVLLPQPQSGTEVNLWLVKVDKDGKKLEVVAGVTPQYKGAALKDVKVTDKALKFTLAVPKGETFGFVMLPPPRDDKETARGSARVGAGITAAWMEKTEQTEIDPKMAVQKVGSLGDLEAALKKADPDEKLKEIAEVAKSHAGRPVGLLAHSRLLGELVRAKAKPQAFKDAARNYIEASKLFGPQMVFGHHLQLANGLRGAKETLAVALESAEAAVKMLDDELPKNQHLSAYLSLSTTLTVAEKKEEADRLAPKMKDLIEEVLKEVPADQKANTTMSLAGTLLAAPAPAVADLGLEYARKGHALLEKDAPITRRLVFDKFLRDGLAARGKKDEAEKMTADIEKIEGELDAAFAKANIPFEAKKFEGRKGKGDRVVLVELFTGAQCPPCVSADVAFDAGIKAYGPKDVVFLQYHLHIPGPDALTNPDSEARQRFYGDEAVAGTPAVLINGKSGPEMGGGRPQAEERYEKLTKALADGLEEDGEAKIKLTAKKDGGKVEIKADVSGLKSPGEKVRLRFALVEEVVRYPGNNGQRLHHQVVRSFPGGAAGFALEKKDSSHAATADVDAVRKALGTYLSGYQTRTRTQFREVPMALKKLKVVAFVQDDESKKVLQAAQVDVE